MELAKLQLSGVRAYKPDENEHTFQSIEFDSPITLITGRNGAGKSAVIEALQYAATGGFPVGTHDGKIFLFDPRIEKKSITKAEVNLKLRKQANSQPISLSWKSKCKTNGDEDQPSFSTVGTTFQEQNGIVPLKTMEMKAKVNSLLNPKIVSNVLLCNQEDNYWPLESSAKVKEVFDEMFGLESQATEFNDLIAKEKQLKLELEKHTISVAILKPSADRHQELKTKLNDNEKELNAYVQQHGDLLEMKRKCEEVVKKREKFDTIKHNIKQIQKDIASEKEQVDSLSEEITDWLAEGEGEIHRQLDDFEIKVAETGAMLKKKGAETKEIRSRIVDLGEKHQCFQKDHGMYTKEQEINCKANTDMQQLLQEISSELTVPKNEHGGPGIEAVLQTLDSQIWEFAATHELELASLGNEEESKKDLYQKQMSAYAKAKAEKDVKETQIKKLAKECATLKKELASLKATTFKLEKLREEEQDLVNEINRSKKSEEVVTEQITHLTQKITQIESDLSTRMTMLDRLKSDTKRVERKNYFSEQLIKKESEERRISGLIQNVENSFLNNTLNGDSENHSMNDSTTTMQSMADCEVELKREICATTSVYDKLLTKLHNIQTTFRIKEAEVSGWQQERDEILKGGDMDQVWKTLSADLAEKTKEESMLDATIAFLQKELTEFICNSESNRRCPTCRRPFEGLKADDEIQIIKNMHTDRIRKFEKKRDKKTLKMEIEKLSKEFASVNNLRLNRANMSAMAEEVLKLDAEVKNITSDVKKNLNLKNEFERSYEDIKKEVRTLQDYSKQLELCENSMLECKKNLQMIEQEIDPDIYVISDFDEQLNIQIEQLQKDLNGINSQKAEVEKEKDLIPKEIELIRKQHNISKNCSNVEAELARITDITNHLSANKSESKKLQVDVQTLNTNIPLVKSEVTKLKDEINKVLLYKQKLELENTEKYQKLNNNWRPQLITFPTKLQEFEHKTKIFRTKETSNNRDQEQVKELKDQLSVLEEEIRTLQQRFYQQDIHKRNLKDNLTIKSRQAKIRALEAKLEQETQSLQNLNNGVTEAEFPELSENLPSLKKELAALTESVDVIFGNCSFFRDAIIKQKEELNSESYRNATTDYTTQEQTLQSSCMELEETRENRKRKDEEIIDCHRQKMVAINELLKIKWRQIYSGNDIDYIQISIDPIPVQEESSQKLKKLYNYRVVMCCNNVELNMRGRCSAGQKMLACLVIRMALLEAFAQDQLNVLALDEPTTNLDDENVKLLVEVLTRLVKDNTESDRKIQLIISSQHDGFIQQLVTQNNVQHYWQVTRNERYSQIEKIALDPEAENRQNGSPAKRIRLSE